MAFIFYFTVALKSLPGLKRGTVRAEILISLPVCGLRPMRALRLLLVKVPKPTRVTSCFFTLFLMIESVSLRTDSISHFLSSEWFLCAAIFSTSSDLFIRGPPVSLLNSLPWLDLRELNIYYTFFPSPPPLTTPSFPSPPRAALQGPLNPFLNVKVDSCI